MSSKARNGTVRCVICKRTHDIAANTWTVNALNVVVCYGQERGYLCFAACVKMEQEHGPDAVKALGRPTIAAPTPVKAAVRAAHRPATPLARGASGEYRQLRKKLKAFPAPSMVRRQ